MSNESSEKAYYSVADLTSLMQAMTQNRVAFIEVPGVLRMGLLPDQKGSQSAPRAEITPEQAMRQMQRQQEEARRQRLERDQERTARLAATAGGISASGGKSIANLADDLAKEAAKGLPATGATQSDE